jgi:hypothetical protein
MFLTITQGVNEDTCNALFDIISIMKKQKLSQKNNNKITQKIITRQVKNILALTVQINVNCHGSI